MMKMIINQIDAVKKYLVSSIVIFLVVVAGYIFLYQQIDKSISEASFMDAKWQDETKKQNNIYALGELVNSIGKEKNDLETHFVFRDSVPRFLDGIENLASASLVDARVTSVNPITEDEPMLVFSMEADGKFSDLYLFLKLLENTPEQLEILAINWSTQEGDNGSWKALFKIRVVSFEP